jgi:RNA polymerase sigma-70 factor (ECF subfamily)
VDEHGDAELVERAKGGQAWAEEALFRKHVDFVAALSGRLLGDRAEADDVTQEAFVAALEGLAKLAVGASFRSWLASITVHLVHRRFRRRRLLSLLGLYTSSHDLAMSTSIVTDAPQQARVELAQLDELLRASSDHDRAAWVLRYVEGYDLAETARLCGCSRTTAKRRIARVNALVKRHLTIAEDDHE